MSDLPTFDRDAYLRELNTEVLEAWEDGGRFFAVLQDTVFYPEGGGQPADHGELNGIPVLDAQKRDGRIIHTLDRAVLSGRAHLSLNWPRRFDHMQQHTGQHLLSALAQDRFGWRTTAFHLGERASDIELDAQTIDLDQLAALEEAVAAEIRAARPVTARWVSPELFATLPVRTRGLPEGHAGDIRLVEIAGIDLTTCGGTHLRSTAEIEALTLLHTERMRGGARLHFVAGARLRRLLAAHEGRSAHLRQLLGVPDDELAAAVAAKLGQLKDEQRRVISLEAELALEAAGALATGSERVVPAHWTDRDAAFLQRVAREFVRLAPDRLALLTAGPADEGFFLLCAGDQVTLDLAAAGREVAGILAGRGGGSVRVFQGKATSLSRRADALAHLRALL